MGDVMSGVGSAFSGVGGAIGSVVGGITSFGGDTAAQNIAQQRLQLAQQNRDVTLGFANQAINVSNPSIEELDQMSNQVQNYSRTLNLVQAEAQRQQAINGSIDPTIMQAANSLRDILSGKQSSNMAPVLAERQRQRQALQDNLRNQMGAGYASSTAGIQALSRFDAETQLAASQVQNQTIGALTGALGGASNARQNTGGFSLQSGQTLNSMSGQQFQELGSLKTRQMNALGMGINAATNNKIDQYGGADYVGDLYRSRKTQDTFNSALELFGPKVAGGGGGGQT